VHADAAARREMAGRAPDPVAEQARRDFARRFDWDTIAAEQGRVYAEQIGR
jgi:hypothetical protein